MSYNVFGGTLNLTQFNSVLSAAESWDRREDNLKKRGHLLTTAELKRRGITRYDAEMLLSQGFGLPEPKTADGTPANKKSRLKSSTPVRFSPRTRNKLPPSSTSQAPTPTSTGTLQKSATKRSVFVRQNRNRCFDRSLRSRTASRHLRFRGDRGVQKSSVTEVGIMTRQASKQTAKDADADRTDFGDDEADNGSLENFSADTSGECSERKVNDVDLALSMSCDAIDTCSSPWTPLKVTHCDGTYNSNSIKSFTCN